MTKKLNICFVAENAVGGIAYYILGQIKLLDLEKFDCTVYLLNFSWREVSPAKQIFNFLVIAGGSDLHYKKPY